MHIIKTIDCHVAGQALRVVTSGFPEPSGATIMEKRRSCRMHLDHLRTALMWEPRGHRNMYGCLLVTPSNPDAHVGVLFFHHEGYSTMCGHGIIGLTTVMLEARLFPMSAPATTIRFDTPSGLVTARASIDGDKVRRVSFLNVPSFVLDREQTIHLPRLGSVRYDVAFGGAFYAFCRAEALGVTLDTHHAEHLTDLGMTIKRAIMAERAIAHPTAPDLSFLYGTIFVSPPHTPEGHVRQVCIFADGALDRSPTGTGVSAHLALLHANGQLRVGQSQRFESILVRCSTENCRGTRQGNHRRLFRKSKAGRT